MLGLIGGIVSSVAGGLLQKREAKKARKQSLEDEAQRFMRLREGAEAAGFNPLTALQYGGSGLASHPSGIAPLASTQAIQGVIKSVSDYATGATERQRVRDQLDIDLAKVRLDQAVAQVQAARVPPLGRSAAMSASGRVTGSGPLSTRTGKAIDPRNTNPIAGNREKDILELSNSPGVFEMENAITGGPITIPGDSEPWGIDELATAAIVGGPQVVYNHRKSLTPDSIARKTARGIGSFVSDAFKDAPSNSVAGWLRDHATGKTSSISRPASGWMDNLYGKGHF